MQGFAYLWLRAGLELVGQGMEQSASDQSQIGQQVGVARARAVLSHEHIASPVIADLYSRPMSADELEPACRGVLLRRGAGKVVARLGTGGPGFLYRALAAHHHQGASVRKVRRQRFYGPGVEGSLFNSSVSGLDFDKKGVFWSRSKACARLKSLG